MTEKDCGHTPLSADASCPGEFPESDRIIHVLQEMKDKGLLQSVKMEFEAEGISLPEAKALDSWASQVDIPLTAKIGGCEAVTDLDLCRGLKVSRVVAPMVESAFAVTKFKGAACRVFAQDLSKVEWVLNLETKTAFAHLDEILEEGQGLITEVNIGRVDLTGSLGLLREQVDGEQVLQVCQDMAKRARAAGYIVGFGGGIGLDSIPFVQAMAPFVDRFETRKAVFGITDDPALIRGCIVDATEFELLCMQGRPRYHGSLTEEDQERLDMLQERLDQAQKG